MKIKFKDSVEIHDFTLVKDLLKYLEEDPNAYISIDSDYDYCAVVLYFEREETDEEYSHRLKLEERNREAANRIAEKKRQQELKLLAELKAKYEPS